MIVAPFYGCVQRGRRIMISITGSTDTNELAADRTLAHALHRVWGFSDFRPLQRDAMHAILASRDSVVVLPTGGGKSLCFQAPAIVRDGGIALIVSPLIS